MSDKGPYRTAEPYDHDGELVPTVAQCRRGYMKAAQAREQSKRREQSAWERYLKEVIEARRHYLEEEETSQARFHAAGKEMLGWRYLAQGFHDEEFSSSKTWDTGSDLSWGRCIQLQDEKWMDHSVDSTLKAFRSSLTEMVDSLKGLFWPEDLEDIWRTYKNTRKKVVDPTRTPSLESNAYINGR
jgi:glutamate synthase domain-containing protein 1